MDAVMDRTGRILAELLRNISPLSVVGSTQVEVAYLCADSRKAGRKSLFVAVRGTKTDGHLYIPQVIHAGASAVVCELLPERCDDGVTYVVVRDASEALGWLASAFYGDPSLRLTLVGVTGTNGKTTTATLLYRLFMRLGFRSGLLSTVINYVGESPVEATHTTPDPISLNALLARMADEGCSYCFMEVSSHSVVQHRIAGLQFAGAVFTNLTHDHLDFHGTFDAYLKAKKAFFDRLSPMAFALTNKDDKNGRVMVQNCKASLHTYALKSMADFRGRIIEPHFEGMLLQINGTEIWTHFIGEFNAYNLLAVYGAASLLFPHRETILTAMSTLFPVDGRFECVRSKSGVLAIVDYAHTPDAVENVLRAIHQLVDSQGSRVITVVGAGGDRDKSKRPEMARIAFRNSHQLILTSDNPRTESPAAILEDMAAGLSAKERTQTLVIADRREAIRTACRLAQKGDVILVAGKGHENYQEVNGVRHHFSDKEELEIIFQAQ